MPQPAFDLRRPVDSAAIYDPPRLDRSAPVAFQPARDVAAKDDPYWFGWRERWEKLPDGSEKLRRIPLTYEDTLNPQLGDHVSADSNHNDLVTIVKGILQRRYEDEPMVAVWSDLKVRLPSDPKGTGQAEEDDATGAKGPSPDVCVMSGVRDRARKRLSFCLEEEPGEILLAIEVVSKTSVKKDYGDILGLFSLLAVAEYILIHPKGQYLDGPVHLQGWRRNPKTKRLESFDPDKEGRLHSKKTGLLFSTGPDGHGLEIRDAKTGKILPRLLDEAKRADEEAAGRQRAEAGQQRAEAGRQRAEAGQQRAEASLLEALAEVERLKALPRQARSETIALNGKGLGK